VIENTVSAITKRNPVGRQVRDSTCTQSMINLIINVNKNSLSKLRIKDSIIMTGCKNHLLEAEP
jgi:hypothetical protein